MSAEQCGSPVAIVLDPPRVVAPEGCDPELYWTKQAKVLLKRVRSKYPNYNPFTIKELYGRAYKMGLLDEE